MKPWVVVPCSGAKRPDPGLMPAHMRYTGKLHRLALDAATALTDLGRIRIASAKYGLIELDRPIEPYDKRIDGLTVDEARRWRSLAHNDAITMLNADLTAQGLPLFTNDHYDRMAPVIALVPHEYAEAMWAASPLLRRTMTRPLAGCGSIGGMRSRLSAISRLGARALELDQPVEVQTVLEGCDA